MTRHPYSSEPTWLYNINGVSVWARDEREAREKAEAFRALVGKS